MLQIHTHITEVASFTLANIEMQPGFFCFVLCAFAKFMSFINQRQMVSQPDSRLKLGII